MRESCRTRQIRAYEQFIRSHPRHPRCEDAFRRIVQLASTPEDYKRNLECADLVDIDKAMYDGQTGELIVVGPRIRKWGHGYLPPLLLLDDFATAIKLLDAESSDLGVALNMIPASREDSSTDDVPTQFAVTFTPAWLGETHFGHVLLEVDRRLKALALGVDGQGEPIWSPVGGYRAVPANSSGNSRAAIPIILRVCPERPMVAFDGYSMRFVGYGIEVASVGQGKSDPAIVALVKHMNANFHEYCREYPILQEFVRLHKLLQVAKWYRAAGFPHEGLKKYKPVRFEPVNVVPILKAGSPDNKVMYYGGIRLTSGQSESRVGVPSSIARTVLGARPKPAASSWPVHVRGGQIVAMAIRVR